MTFRRVCTDSSVQTLFTSLVKEKDRTNSESNRNSILYNCREWNRHRAFNIERYEGGQNSLPIPMDDIQFQLSVSYSSIIIK